MNASINNNLADIATSLSIIANNIDGSTYDSILHILLGAIVALIGALAHHFFTVAKQRKQDINRRAHLFQLLCDEIDLRWTNTIFSGLNDEVFGAEGLECLRKYSSIGLAESDLFVFKHIADRFSDFAFIENRLLISKVIHAQVMWVDLIWKQKKAAVLVTAIDGDSGKEERFKAEIESRVKLIKGDVEKLNRALQQIRGMPGIVDLKPSSYSREHQSQT